MTLNAYLGFLSLGSAIQTRFHTECQEEERHELERLQRMAQQVTLAEIDTVSTVSIHNAPSERKVEVKENISGVALAISTMIANYSLCFPIVAARHRLQALPTLHSYKRDTPIYGLQSIIYTYKLGGIRRLYPGFGLGLIGQSISATYESGVNQIMSHAITSANKRNKKILSNLLSLLTKGLTLFINIPLYPLYRNALILRVQSDSDLTRVVIHNSRDFIDLYKQELNCFWPTNPNYQHIISAFLPSCILNAVTEKLLIFIYRFIYQKFSNESLSSNDGESSTTTQTNASKKKKELTVLHTFYPEIACGVISSMFTRALSYPIDTVIFRLMLQDSGVLKTNTTYTGFFDCIKKMWYEEGGWKGFYPGWGVGVLEVTVGCFILETSWWAYHAIEWKLRAPGSSDTRAVRKARKLKERLM
ncbi:mitochondrial carrier domain-containing protein [Cokeromyces recurvatus]|uniref:mitochondrial carrier domain-containing protein n=1 Tax=Cokeromyces recurvatus TaxID=90255 RepID=UPI00221E74F1|nr:mitochondrial carrier domain-containing protein [Cokeromyces recurvatus]KAI7902812.1 mitochondrial carrier domain-containing protein [Cokeromyces recurvatus]